MFRRGRLRPEAAWCQLSAPSETRGNCPLWPYSSRLSSRFVQHREKTLEPLFPRSGIRSGAITIHLIIFYKTWLHAHRIQADIIEVSTSAEQKSLIQTPALIPLASPIPIKPPPPSPKTLGTPPKTLSELSKRLNMCITLGIRLLHKKRRSNQQARAGYPGDTPGAQDYAPKPHPVNGAPQYSYAQPNGQPVKPPYEPNKSQQ